MPEPDHIVYNVPAELFDTYHRERVIVRSYDPKRLTERLARRDLSRVHYVQILTLGSDTSILTDWHMGMPIDLVMYEPEVEFGKLYDHVPLLTKHPVRVTIPVRYRFASAVKAAVSLRFSVKLTVGQPDTEDLAQMLAVLYMFLYKPTLAQPIEFYQSMLDAFFHGRGLDLWKVQEDDPARFRYVSSEGNETASPRLLDVGMADTDLGSSLNGFREKLVSEHRECVSCRYFDRCRGYFKWPNTDYVCAGGIRDLFKELEEAAEELGYDLNGYLPRKSGFETSDACFGFY